MRSELLASETNAYDATHHLALTTLAGMDDLDLSDLWSDDSAKACERFEQYVVDNFMEGSGLWSISNWSESTLQMLLWCKLREAGVDVEYERRGRSRRADLLVVDGDRRIVLEIKYTQADKLTLPAGPPGEKNWQRRDRLQSFIESAPDLLELEFTPYNREEVTTVKQRHVDTEILKLVKTASELEATEAFIVVGVGHRLAVQRGLARPFGDKDLFPALRR